MSTLGYFEKTINLERLSITLKIVNEFRASLCLTFFHMHYALFIYFFYMYD